MIRLRRIIRDLFGFSRAQVNAFMLFLPLMIIILFSHPLYRWMKPPETFFTSRDRVILDSMVALLESDTLSSPAEQKQERAFFDFDPNNVSHEQMVSLGFSVSLSSRIANYREKGGKFRTKRDLLKIYGMDTAFYNSLYAYIRLPENIDKGSKPLSRTFEASPIERARFDLNLADTSQLKSIKGIGEKLSQRILNYREALGGFTGMIQLYEVYGLDSMVVNRLIKSSFIDEKNPLRRMNINKLEERALSAHPYISKSVAKAIVSYRFQHGDFRQVEDLRNIPVLDAKTIQKITPYLTFN